MAKARSRDREVRWRWAISSRRVVVVDIVILLRAGSPHGRSLLQATGQAVLRAQRFDARRVRVRARARAPCAAATCERGKRRHEQTCHRPSTLTVNEARFAAVPG